MTAEDWTRDELLAALAWQLDAGIDEAIGDVAINGYELSQEQIQSAAKSSTPRSSHQTSNPGAQAAPPPPPKASAAKRVLRSFQKTLIEAQKLANSADNLPDLATALDSFDGCSLKKTAINTVFDQTPSTADIMIIMGAPRADEDREGKTVAGSNRKLMINMLKSIGLNIEDVYLSTCVFWRPPGDKKPTANDLACCKPFIDRQIELVAPKALVLMGESTLRGFIDPDASLLRQRGKWIEYSKPTGDTIPAIATFAPHMLLNTPRQKALAWQDLREIKSRLA
ncbi:uracil-DNA glycosylase [Kiloniella sp. EL199]|uniref:uracil-DNA glycosylase n=1 Tax=Kiloniella sp. EL199 TaxID=2107581 RepID=UPI000EA34F61|nr:uracil-DNA glycosylase [Kiloniella sp. EL199]